MLSLFRRLGADLPFADPRRAHGTAFEGWFWRFTDVASGRVVVALCGINRDRRGDGWGTVALAAHPGGVVRSAATAHAEATPGGLALCALDGARVACAADDRSVRIDLGDDAWLDARLDGASGWSRRHVFGGIGLAHAVPGLSQYWHPHMLAGRVRGSACIAGEPIALDGATAYAEKNWGPGGFPPAWWWGQAHGFDGDPGACVAFAGGHAGLGHLGRARMRATSLVVRAGGETIRLAPPTALVRARVGAREWRLEGRSATHRVTVEGHANGTAPHLLPIPLPADRRNLDGAAAQHLAGELTVEVRRGARLRFRGTSRLAGLEVGSAP